MGEAILRPAVPRENVLLLVVAGPLVAGHIQPIRTLHGQRATRAHHKCRSRARSVIGQGIGNFPSMVTGEGLGVSARSCVPLAFRSILGWESPVALGEGAGARGSLHRVRAAREYESGTHTA